MFQQLGTPASRRAMRASGSDGGERVGHDLLDMSSAGRTSSADPGRSPRSAAPALAALALGQPTAPRPARSSTTPSSGWVRARTRRAVVVLPEPDSPTMPSVSPGAARGDVVDNRAGHAVGPAETLDQVICPNDHAVGGSLCPRPAASGQRRDGCRRRRRKPRAACEWVEGIASSSARCTRGGSGFGVPGLPGRARRTRRAA